MSDLSKEQLDSVYEVIEVARATGKIKKGTNETTKAIEKGTAKVVAYASDISPAEVIMHIPLLCKDKGIPCFAVPSKTELGAAAGIGVSTSAVAVTEEGNAKKILSGLLKETDSKKETKAKEEVEKTETKEEVEKTETKEEVEKTEAKEESKSE
jgi:large subunit ribosomal protein L7Ae